MITKNGVVKIQDLVVNHESQSFKGYPCYKTVTSQYVLSEAQVKYFFIS